METHLDKKFYVPEISEFHVGFEYEIKYDFDSQITGMKPGHPDWIPKIVESNEWEKKIFDEYDSVNPNIVSFFMNYDPIINKNNDFTESLIRVKCLDKEDIESLGFIYYGTISYHTRNNVEESGFLKKLEDDSNVYIKCFLDKDNKVDSDLDIQSTDIYTSDKSTPWDAYCEGGCGPSAQQIIIKNKSELVVLLKQMHF